MLTESLKQIIRSADQQRILCLGDVMLDHFIHGTVSRISPEAPVPVLSQTHAELMPGGAANTARNLGAMGARTRLVGMIGADQTGEDLKALLAETENVDAHLFVDPQLITSRKTRMVSNGHQLMRLDHEAVSAPNEAVEAELLAAIAEAAEGATAILVSDYAKGMVTPDLIAAVLSAGLAAGIPVIVDPKGDDIARYGPVDLLKPNAAELAAMVNMPTGSDAEIASALHMAMELSAVQAILVTRAGRGLSFLKRDGDVQHMSGVARDVFDVSGAGDTSLAALGIALSAGAPLGAAAALALAASGLVVGKLGTATVSPVELLSAGGGRVLNTDEMAAQVQSWRASGLSVGFTNGCFDILHPGHLHVLEEARARCDRLIVGLNDDASVRRLKGEGRPVNDQHVRAQMLAGITSVDAIAIFEEDTPLKLITALQPDLLVKGGDYSADTVVGGDVVRARGGAVHIVPLIEGQSTTATILRASSEPDET